MDTDTLARLTDWALLTLGVLALFTAGYACWAIARDARTDERGRRQLRAAERALARLEREGREAMAETGEGRRC